MEDASSNPIFVPLLFVLRCLVPLLIMLGITYLLKKLHLVAPPPPPPSDWDNGSTNDNPNGEGGMAHGKV